MLLDQKDPNSPQFLLVIPLNLEEHLVHAGQEIVVQNGEQLFLAATLALLELLGQIDPVLFGLAHTAPRLAQLLDRNLGLHDRRIALLQTELQTVAEADLADVRRMVH